MVLVQTNPQPPQFRTIPLAISVSARLVSGLILVSLTRDSVSGRASLSLAALEDNHGTCREDLTKPKVPTPPERQLTTGEQLPLCFHPRNQPLGCLDRFLVGVVDHGHLPPRGSPRRQ